MSRSGWLSLMLVALSFAVVATGRVVMELDRVSLGSALVAEVDALPAGPPPSELSLRVTDAAGCYPRLVPPDKACLYVWGHPTRTDYVRLVAARIRDKGSGEAFRWGAAAAAFWALTAVLGWRALGPRRRRGPRGAGRPSAGQPVPAGSAPRT